MKPGVTFDPCACGIHRDDCSIHRLDCGPIVNFQSLMDKLDPTLKVDVLNKTILIIHDTTRGSYQMWSMKNRPENYDWAHCVHAYFQYHRVKHPEHYHKCSCHNRTTIKHSSEAP